MQPTVTNRIRINPTRLENLRKVLQQASRSEVAVGYPANKEGLGEPWYEGGASVIDVALYNNYGMGVPRRAFMDLARQKMQEMYMVEVEKLRPKIAAGEVDIDKFLKALGMKAAEEVRKAIMDGGWEANTPETVARKGSARPLVDTGELARRATYLVRPKS